MFFQIDKMKILAFTDSHGSNLALKRVKEKVKKNEIDYILCVGDVTIFEQSLTSIMKKINKLGRLVLMVHGNHESLDSVRMHAARLDNVLFIHKTHQRIGKHLVVGYGGGGFSIEDKGFEKWIKKAMKNKKKGDKVIVVLHGPPHGVVQDMVLDGHVGNKSFTKFILDYQPDLVVCGHIHENQNTEDKIGKTKIINPGPFGKVIEI